MKVFFSQPEFDNQLLRTLSYTPTGGADLGECLNVAAKIKEGDFESWYQEWTNLADRLMTEGYESESNNHHVSASHSFLRASNYYRTSFFFLAGQPVDPRVINAYNKHTEAFEKGIHLLPLDVEEVSIPYQQTLMNGYFYKNHSGNLAKGTILTFPGYDGTHQECYFLVIKGALERGYNVLSFDGPGQGDMLINKQIYMTAEWDRVISPAVDYLLQRKDVNPDLLAMIGISWGGMLAPLAACYEHRIPFLITIPGQYEALQSIKKAIPQVEELLHENNFTLLDQIFSKILSDKMVAAKFKYKMWVHGVDTAFELIKDWANYSLVDKADQIKCATLILDCENEPFSSGQAKQLFDALKCPKQYKLLKNSEGAGEHCAAGAVSLLNQRIYDWLEESIKSLEAVNLQP